MRMKQSSRLFNCECCHAQTVVRSDCDRGQIYCGKMCSQTARAQSHRLANKRYQASFKGRMNHALRQRRYRESKIKVTDQGSLLEGENDVLLSIELTCSEPEIQSVVGCDVCHFCKKPVTSFFRLGFLQQMSTTLTFFRLKDKKCFQPLMTGDL